MFTKIATIILYALVLSSNITAQITEEWISRYKGSSNSFSSSGLCLDRNRNILIASSTYESSTKEDYCIIKYNQRGDTIWIRKYNNPEKDSSDMAWFVATDESSNVYVTGISKGLNTKYDTFTMKYDSSGNFKWSKRYNGTFNGDDLPRGIKLYQGFIYIAGTTCNGAYALSNCDYFLIKYDTLGTLIWTRTFNGTANRGDDLSSFFIDGLGNIYVTGRSEPSAGTNSNYMTIKYNSSGDSLWASTYNNGDFDHALSIVVDSGQNAYVTGYSVAPSTFIDYCTIKYSPNGSQQWVNRYNGYNDRQDWSYKILLNRNGEPIITGESVNLEGGSDIATIRYNSLGQEQWIRRNILGGTGFQQPSNMCLDKDDNIYIVGERTENQQIKLLLTKYNTNGDLQFNRIYASPQNLRDRGIDIIVDSLYNIYVTGLSRVDSTRYDIITIKYSQPIGIQTITTEIPNSFELHQNYPNPFNPLTKVVFALPNSSFTRLVIYDILGNEVKIIVNEQLNAGIYQIDFDGSQLSSGLYFYRLETDKFNDTKKMVLLK